MVCSDVIYEMIILAIFLLYRGSLTGAITLEGPSFKLLTGDSLGWKEIFEILAHRKVDKNKFLERGLSHSRQ